jgi:hypothetical protein
LQRNTAGTAPAFRRDHLVERHAEARSMTDVPTSVEVARLIAGDAPPPDWLPAVLARVALPLLQLAQKDEGRQPRRAVRRKRSLEVERACRLLMDVLAPGLLDKIEQGHPSIRQSSKGAVIDAAIPRTPSDDDTSVRADLDAAAPAPLGAPELNTLFHLLRDVRNRARCAAETIPEGGGRGRPFATASASAMDRCAMLISEAWCVVHGERPAPGNERAQLAASELWRASGALERSWGSKNTGWRRHFQAITRFESERSRTQQLLEDFRTQPF